MDCIRSGRFGARALLSALIALTALTVFSQVCFAQAPSPDTNAPATTPPAAPQATPPGPTAPAAPQQTPSAPAAPAPAAAPAAPKLTLSGLVDAYYLWDFHSPNSHVPQNDLFTPIYDARYNTPSISLAELNVALAPPAQGGLGFKATLEVGDTADLNHGGLGVGPDIDDEARFKNIQQLYLTYLASSGYGVDLGEFYTPFGYEVTESSANYNYSRSLIFELMEPVYHSGIRVYTPSLKGLVATLYLVRALNNSPTEGVDDDNQQPGYIGQLSYTDPKSRFTAVETLGYSEDRNIAPFDPNETLPSPNYSDKTTLSDTDFTYNLNATNLIGLTYAYRKDDLAGAPDVTTNGFAGYYRNQFTKRNALALRYSTVDAKQSGSGGVEPWEITATLEDKSAANFLTRLEYRHDAANADLYLGSTTFNQKEQDTLSLSEVYSFP